MRRFKFNNRIDHFPKEEGVFYSDISKKHVVRVLKDNHYISLFQSKDKDLCDEVFKNYKDGNIKPPKW